MKHPVVLWCTLSAGLLGLLTPIYLGVLQGTQNFLWLGWAMLTQGLVRFVSVSFLVLFLKSQSGGAMGAVVVAMGAGLWIAWHFSRPWLRDSHPERPDWKAWLGQVVPLILGLGGTMFMLSFDTIFAQTHFPAEEVGRYTAAGLIGRGLYFFAMPLTQVMFPKVVKSAAASEKSDVLFMVLLAITVVGGSVCLLFTFAPTVPFRLAWFQQKYDQSAYLIPWFCWGMLPLSLSTVLLNNLFARLRFAVVPWIIGVGLLYVFLLNRHHDTLLQVVQMMALSNCVLFVITLIHAVVGRQRGALATPAVG
jgi:O-antigen/teichoic acid export membrane protein